MPSKQRAEGPERADVRIATEKRVAEDCARIFAEFELTIKHDDELYRHLRCGKPGDSAFSFNIVTWPGHLTIAGDIGSWTFSRVEDMFTFFRGDRINPDYWQGKLVGNGQHSASTRWTREAFAARVAEWREELFDPSWGSVGEMNIDRRRELQVAIAELASGEHADYEHPAMVALSEFDCQGIRIEEFYEWGCTDWDTQFLMCLHGIVWAIKAYDAATPDEGSGE
jgi:hypothetical protein